MTPMPDATPQPDLQRPSWLVEMTSGDGVLKATMATPAIGSQEASEIDRTIIAGIKRLGESMRFLVLDLTGVTFMNSMGLGMIIPGLMAERRVARMRE